MASDPIQGGRGRMPRTLRWGLRILLIAGLGTVLHLGASLARLNAEPAEPNPSPSTVLPKPGGGSLVIVGGGVVPEEIRDRFVELAGGPNARILVVPTASGLPENADFDAYLDPWKPRRIRSVSTLHTLSRDRANDPAFARPIEEATGVWFSGGRQSFITNAYRGTEVEKALKKLLARGGVIGGTSAGAAVMSRVMIEGGRNEAQIGEGFDFLPAAVIDQHFLRRNRVKRLAGVVKRHPELVGLGIDEQTALVVDVRNNRMRVLGNSYVVACLPGPAPAEGKEPSTRFEVLKPGDEADLNALKTLMTDAVIPGIDFNGL